MTTRNPHRSKRTTKLPRLLKPCLQLEVLEERSLLSGFAQPHHIFFQARGGDGSTIGSPPAGYSPGQIRQAYGIDQITYSNGTIKGDGAGTTIAIVDALDNTHMVSSTDPNFNNSDLHQFDLQFNLPDPIFKKVNQRGGTTYPLADAGWAGEIALDVEWAHAIAPKAAILLVEADDSAFSNLFAGVSYAASQPGVVAVSMSFGGGEYSSETSFDNIFKTPNGHAGVTFIASSGDSGAPPNYPAISPNVLSVGGTTLSLDGKNNISLESGWSGSGGGISAFESQPSYQNGVVTQSSTMRTNPDVAYHADPSNGYPVYDTVNNSANSPWEQVGGTSAAAPQWAAIIAIANQGRALSGAAALDGVNDTLPMIYKLNAADFHDITTGASYDGFPVYYAGPGYDLVTGRGTPAANKIVGDLVGVVDGAEAPSQSPTQAMVAPFDSFQLKFDRPVEMSTFTTSIVSAFKGYFGDLTNATFTITALNAGNGPATTIKVDFIDQNASGNHYTVIGAIRTDTYGNKMDQNENFKAGKVPDDKFTSKLAMLSRRGLDSFVYIASLAASSNLEIDD